MAKYYFGNWHGQADPHWLDQAMRLNKAAVDMNQEGDPFMLKLQLLGKVESHVGGCFELELEGARDDDNEYQAQNMMFYLMQELRARGLWRGGKPEPRPSVPKAEANDLSKLN